MLSRACATSTADTAVLGSRVPSRVFRTELALMAKPPENSGDTRQSLAGLGFWSRAHYLRYLFLPAARALITSSGHAREERHGELIPLGHGNMFRIAAIYRIISSRNYSDGIIIAPTELLAAPHHVMSIRV